MLFICILHLVSNLTILNYCYLKKKVSKNILKRFFTEMSSSQFITFELDSENLLSCQSIESFDTTFISSHTNTQRANSNHPRAPSHLYTSTNNFAFAPVNLQFQPWRP